MASQGTSIDQELRNYVFERIPYTRSKVDRLEKHEVAASVLAPLNELQFLTGYDYFTNKDLKHALVISDAGVGKTRQVVAMVMWYIMWWKAFQEGRVQIPPPKDHVYVVALAKAHMENLKAEFAAVLGDLEQYDPYLQFHLRATPLDGNAIVVLDEFHDTTKRKGEVSVSLEQALGRFPTEMGYSFIIMTATIITNDTAKLKPVAEYCEAPEVPITDANPTGWDFGVPWIGIYYVATQAENLYFWSGYMTRKIIEGVPWETPAEIPAYINGQEFDRTISLEPMRVEVGTMTKTMHAEAIAKTGLGGSNNPITSGGGALAILNTATHGPGIQPPKGSAKTKSAGYLMGLLDETNIQTKKAVSHLKRQPNGHKYLAQFREIAYTLFEREFDSDAEMYRERFMAIYRVAPKIATSILLHKARRGKLLAYYRLRTALIDGDRTADHGELIQFLEAMGYTNFKDLVGAPKKDEWYYMYIPKTEGHPRKYIKAISDASQYANIYVVITEMFAKIYSFLTVSTMVIIARAWHVAMLKQAMSRIARLMGLPDRAQALVFLTSYAVDRVAQEGTRRKKKVVVHLRDFYNVYEYVMPKIRGTQPAIDYLRGLNRLASWISGRGKSAIDPGAGEIPEGQYWRRIAVGYETANSQPYRIHPEALMEAAILLSSIPEITRKLTHRPNNALYRMIMTVADSIKDTEDNMVAPYISRKSKTTSRNVMKTTTKNASRALAREARKIRAAKRAEAAAKRRAARST